MTTTDEASASSSDVTHMSSDSEVSDPDSDGDLVLGGPVADVHHANGVQNANAIPIAAARIRRREPP